MKSAGRLVVVLLVLLLLSTVTVSASSAQGPVVPPNATVQHKTYEEWLARYFQWLFALPASQNPAFGSVDACILQPDGKVTMAAFSPVSGGVLDCGELPRNTALYLIAPVATECSQVEAYPYHGDDEAGLIDCVGQFTFTGLSASLDGVPIPAVEDYIMRSPLYLMRYQADNGLGASGPGKTWSVARGPVLMFAPMSPGVHTIELHGRVTAPEGSFLQGDATLVVTAK